MTSICCRLPALPGQCFQFGQRAVAFRPWFEAVLHEGWPFWRRELLWRRSCVVRRRTDWAAWSARQAVVVLIGAAFVAGFRRQVASLGGRLLSVIPVGVLPRLSTSFRRRCGRWMAGGGIRFLRPWSRLLVRLSHGGHRRLGVGHEQSAEWFCSGCLTLAPEPHRLCKTGFLLSPAGGGEMAAVRFGSLPY